MNHAVGCEMPKSLCNFMLDTPFRFVAMRYMPNAHVRKPRLESAMTVAVFKLK